MAVMAWSARIGEVGLGKAWPGMAGSEKEGKNNACKSHLIVVNN